jgi:hypothetical protein
MASGTYGQGPFHGYDRNRRALALRSGSAPLRQWLARLGVFCSGLLARRRRARGGLALVGWGLGSAYRAVLPGSRRRLRPRGHLPDPGGHRVRPPRGDRSRRRAVEARARVLRTGSPRRRRGGANRVRALLLRPRRLPRGLTRYSSARNPFVSRTVVVAINNGRRRYVHRWRGNSPHPGHPASHLASLGTRRAPPLTGARSI